MHRKHHWDSTEVDNNFVVAPECAVAVGGTAQLAVGTEETPAKEPVVEDNSRR